MTKYIKQKYDMSNWPILFANYFIEFFHSPSTYNIKSIKGQIWGIEFIFTVLWTKHLEHKFKFNGKKFYNLFCTLIHAQENEIVEKPITDKLKRKFSLNILRFYKKNWLFKILRQILFSIKNIFYTVTSFWQRHNSKQSQPL